MRPIMGFLNSIITIMILKIWRELPDMYIIIAFMGMDFAGAKATSQAFFSLRRAVSCGVGGMRVDSLEGPSFWRREGVSTGGESAGCEEWGGGGEVCSGRRELME
jgi:hypothetical protein